MVKQTERWIDPDVLKSFKAAIPATEASGDYAKIWPYSLYHPGRGVWVAFSNLAELEAATMPESNEKIIEKTLSNRSER